LSNTIRFFILTGVRALIISAILTATNIVSAETVEIGNEFWVDGPVSVQPGTDRESPAVALDDPAGQSVIAWAAFVSPFRYDIYVRTFDSEDQALSDPVLVNVTDADDQRYPRLALRPDCSFRVIC